MLSKKQKKINNGFTLIECLVAVTVLMIAITGPLALATTGLSYSRYAKDEITAFYLASEAIEAVKNIRDANMILPQEGKDWLGGDENKSGGLYSCQNISAPCYFDVWKNPPDVRFSWDEINSGDNRDIPNDFSVYEKTLGEKKFFGWSFDMTPESAEETKEPTIFRRKIIVTPIVSDTEANEVRVTVVVDWYANKNILREVVLTTNLFKLKT